MTYLYNSRSVKYRMTMLDKLKSLKTLILTCVVAGTILTILSPYGTHDMQLTVRLVFWIGLCLVGGLAVAGTSKIIERQRPGLPPFSLICIYSVASAIAVFLAMLALSYLHGGNMRLGSALQLFFYIWVIAFTISLVGVLAHRRKDEDVDSTQPNLYQRLKPGLRQAKIYALSAEDHYVRVITGKGEDLILMRLSDAIKEASPLPGLSPHRSWWVAEQGVAKSGRKALTLHTGEAVPVSRNGLKTVKEAGWL